METIINIMLFCVLAYFFFNYVLLWLFQLLIITLALCMYIGKTIYLSFKKKLGRNYKQWN